MKNVKKLVFAIFFTAVLLFAFTSCGGDDEVGAVSGDKVVTLNVYNWGEYISDGFQGSVDSNAKFEEYFNTKLSEKYGFKISVNYTTYATNEDMYSKLSSGAGTYDVIIPSDYMIQKMIGDGGDDCMLEPLDFDIITNFGNINDSFKGDAAYYDPGNVYSVPYTYGMLGVIYNTALVDEEDYSEESWGLLWNPKYKGKILQFNNPRDAFGSAMYYLNYDVNSTDPEVWNNALAKLVEQKPYIQGYVNDEIFNKMTTASAAVAPYYAGDFLTMAYQNEDLAFYYPKEGTNYFVDAMCIPKNARNKDVANEYINFMLTEEVAVANALYIGYASPNKLVLASDEYKDGMAELHEDWHEILYGKTPEEANANYSFSPGYESFSPEIQAHVNTLWESLKTENATEAWVHIVCLVIVVGVVSLAGYNIYIKKKRSKDYRMRDKLAAKARLEAQKKQK